MSNSRHHGIAIQEVVAGNGLLHRRALLGRGIMVAGAMGAGAAGALTGAAAEPLAEAPWSLEPGDATPPYGHPSPFEKGVVRTVDNPKNEPGGSRARTPHQLLKGTITPNGLHFTIRHAGIPDIDPAQHKLLIHGMVKQPLLFDLDSLSRYRMVTRVGFMECGGNSAPLFSNEPIQTDVQALHGLASCAEWAGVPLATLLDEAGVEPGAKWVIAEGTDAPHLSRSVPLAKIMDDALVAMFQNGERIQPGQGYPMRLYLPGYEGNMNVKFLRRIQVTDQPGMTYFESKIYTDPLPDGKDTQFYFVQEVKSSSLRRHPASRSRSRASMRFPASLIPATDGSRKLSSPLTAVRAGAKRRSTNRGCPRPLRASVWRGGGTADRPSCRAGRGTRAATCSRPATSSWLSVARPQSRRRCSVFPATTSTPSPVGA